MKVWRLIAHHIDSVAAANYYRENSVIALGWGAIGDLKKSSLYSQKDISRAITEVPHYQSANNAGIGGACLWAFCHEMSIGDFVIVNANKKRLYVMRVTGPYYWVTEEERGGPYEYQHRRAAELTALDPDELWNNAYQKIKGWSVRWALTMINEDYESGFTKQPNVKEEDDKSRFPEGVENFKFHRTLERDPRFSKRAKELRLANVGELRCDVCNFSFSDTYGEIGNGFIEAHHTIPVSEIKGTRHTKIEEIALVCSNCHRMLHSGDELLSIEELQQIIFKFKD